MKLNHQHTERKRDENRNKPTLTSLQCVRAHRINVGSGDDAIGKILEVVGGVIGGAVNMLWRLVFAVMVRLMTLAIVVWVVAQAFKLL